MVVIAATTKTDWLSCYTQRLVSGKCTPYKYRTKNQCCQPLRHQAVQMTQTPTAHSELVVAKVRMICAGECLLHLPGIAALVIEM